MSPHPPFVSFLSDFGTRDEFVGVCHAVMLDIAPQVRILDITHEIPPFDVRAGSLALVRAVQYLPAGLVLAVVDPGVGTERRLVGIEIEAGVLVGPDNGLLAPAVAMAGGARRVVSLTSTTHQLERPGETFAARDVMAPACAHLVNGIDLADLGEEVAAASLVPGLVPLAEPAEDGFSAEVLWVDRFGNSQLNIGPDELVASGLGLGDAIEVRVGERTHRARWVGTYGDAKPSELVVVVDSYGLCSLALDRASAAERCALSAGTRVGIVVPRPGGDASAEVSG